MLRDAFLVRRGRFDCTLVHCSIALIRTAINQTVHSTRLSHHFSMQEQEYVVTAQVQA